LLLALIRLGLWPLLRAWMGRPLPLHDIGVSLRRFLDRGGLVYRKLGQYLAMRTDLLPAVICQELDLLFEAVTPMAPNEVRRLIEVELGRPLHDCFVDFDPVPVGSASVAQVHRATALDGQSLAVKVQRAGIREQFAADVRVFRRVAGFLDLFRLTGALSLRQLFDEFAQFTSQELNFEVEGRTAEGLRAGMPRPGYVPAVRWDLTTPRLLTMEFIHGESFLALCRLNEAGRTQELSQLLHGIDLHSVVVNLANECFRQLFVTGFFHGDPHPGNVILREDGSFAFLDCGISGTLSPHHRSALGGFVESLALRRFYESAHYYTRLCQVTSATDLDAWLYDVSCLLASWHASLRNPRAPIEDRHMGRLQGNIAAAMRNHNVRTRPNQLLVWRALVLLDTTTLRLPNRFDVLGAMRAFFERHRGNLAAILRQTSASWRAETTQIGPNVFAPVRALVGSETRPSALTVHRSRAGGRPESTRRMLYAIGALCGGLLLPVVPPGLRAVPLAWSLVLLVLAAVR
jgi:ubiquinone biosynthesis protein